MVDLRRVSQNCCTKWERQRLEGKRRTSQKIRGLGSCIKQTGQRQVSGSEGKNRGGQGNGVGGRANEVRQVGTSV